MTKESLSPPPASTPIWKRALLLWGCVGGSALAWQASSPLTGAWAAPAPANLVCGVGLFALWIVFALGKENDRRLGALINIVAAVHVLEVTRGFAGNSAFLFASSLTGALSWTLHGIALAGLLHAWNVIVLSWLLYQAALIGLCVRGQKHRYALTAIFWLLGAVGVRAVIGYATGSPSLL